MLRKAGGSWTTNGWETATDDLPAVYTEILIDRTVLTNDLVMDLWFKDTEARVGIDLCEADGGVLTNLIAQITAGSGDMVLRRYRLPLSTLPGASNVRIVRAAGEGAFALSLTALYVDMDADGLDAAQEAQLGTSDLQADTDGDGVSDFTEIMVDKTDALFFDADFDGVADSDELAAGLDPHNADTDGDGLPDGVECNRSVYAVVIDSCTWAEAKIRAEELGGHLAVITAAEEHAALLAMVDKAKLKDRGLWIGATDEGHEGIWTWVTGEPFDFAMWTGRQPDNF